MQQQCSSSAAVQQCLCSVLVFNTAPDLSPCLQAHGKSVVEEPCGSGWCLKVRGGGGDGAGCGGAGCGGGGNGGDGDGCGGNGAGCGGGGNGGGGPPLVVPYGSSWCLKVHYA